MYSGTAQLTAKKGAAALEVQPEVVGCAIYEILQYPSGNHRSHGIRRAGSPGAKNYESCARALLTKAKSESSADDEGTPRIIMDVAM